jgi:predicted unusual protein kinase regulating ubiquinone biosynthesis (AarF/ABC1/UbiB family)
VGAGPPAVGVATHHPPPSPPPTLPYTAVWYFSVGANAGVKGGGVCAYWACFVCVIVSPVRRNALYLYNTMLRLKGMWVKLGQYMSSRNDLLPDEYIPVLTKLQDRIMPRPIEEVRAVVEAEFSKPIAQLFAELEPNALAAASIGQVHRGKLLDGTVVAVKVQHAGMQELLASDVANSRALMSWVQMVEPDFDFKKVCL